MATMPKRRNEITFYGRRLMFYALCRANADDVIPCPVEPLTSLHDTAKEAIIEWHDKYPEVSAEELRIVSITYFLQNTLSGTPDYMAAMEAIRQRQGG